MPEKRGQQHHRERLSEALREEIETILEGELGDPRIGLVNVSEVQLAPDSRSARAVSRVRRRPSMASSTWLAMTGPTLPRSSRIASTFNAARTTPRNASCCKAS